MKQSCPVITIDGPSGTGKGTLSQMLAQKLEWNLLDSGSLYRLLALAAKNHHVSFDNEEALQVLAAHLDVQFKATGTGKVSRAILEGEDVSDAIRAEECGNDASKIAALPAVREALLERQRAFAEKPGLVTDGRDMGTVVFPQADLKIYLDASHEERVNRRFAQLKEKGVNVSLAQVSKEITERDKRDTKRAVAPLKPATDAVRLDTTNLSIEQVMELVLQEVKKKLSETCDES